MIKKKIIKKITLVNTSLYNNSTTVLLQFDSPLSALNLIFSIALSTYIQHAINITKQTISCILIIRFMYLTSFIFINFIEEFFRPPPCPLDLHLNLFTPYCNYYPGGAGGVNNF